MVHLFQDASSAFSGMKRGDARLRGGGRSLSAELLAAPPGVLKAAGESFQEFCLGVSLKSPFEFSKCAKNSLHLCLLTRL